MKVYYTETGAGTYTLGGRRIPISHQHHLFIPSHKLYFNGIRFTIPGYLDLEDGQFTADFRGVDLDKPDGDWMEYPYEGMPRGATEVEVDDSFVEKILRAREDLKMELKRFGEEMKKTESNAVWEDFGAKVKARVYPKIKSNPFEYCDKLSESIEELFHTYVDSKEPRPLTPPSKLDYKRFLATIMN